MLPVYLLAGSESVLSLLLSLIASNSSCFYMSEMSYLKSLMEYETDIVGNHFLVDPFKVFDVLNNIVSLIKVQMMRDRYTTPECNYETLTRMISLKLEDDRSLEVYFNELLDLLKKPGTDGPVIKMMISRM